MSSSPMVPVTIKPIRNIIGGSITLTADATIDEHHYDKSIITDHPVEQGSVVSDNVYNLPEELELNYAWSLGSSQNSSSDPSFLKTLYQQALALKATATLLMVNTGKRVYSNMVIQEVEERTDKENENSMTLRIVLKQIIIATTQILPLTTAAVQTMPQKTAPVQNNGAGTLQPAPNYNSSATP